MGGQSPVATVVIPVWDDYVQFLQEAVQSVRDDAPRTPIIIVDNASTWPLPKLDGVALIHTERRLSAGAARNLGIDAVETPYLLVLDADDKLLPGTLAFLVDRLEADPSLALSVTSILEGDTGERHRFPRRFVRRLTRWRRTFAFMDCIWSLFPLQGCALMRTEQVREAGGYADSDWGEDWPLAASLAFRGRVEVNDRLGRFYRHTPESLWRRPRRFRELAATGRLVRDRLRSDAGIPRWGKALLPLIALGQLTAVYVVRPPYIASRALSPGKARSGS
jgi:glycosyltransferase involved in cell wall biosynthesis